jgi:hypothetical protein
MPKSGCTKAERTTKHDTKLQLPAETNENQKHVQVELPVFFTKKAILSRFLFDFAFLPTTIRTGKL